MANLIGNPIFETAGGGGADVFGTWGESAGTGAIARDTSVKYTGSASAKITAGSSANTYIYQTVSVLPGKDKELVFFTRGDGTYAGRYSVYDVTNSAYIINITSTGIVGTAFAPVSLTFTAPNTCVSLMLHLRCPDTNTGVAYFDSVYLKEREEETRRWNPWRR